MEGQLPANEPNLPRRSLRIALSEINESLSEHSTPNKSVSPEEILVSQRGPRRKPVTWSPVDYKFNLLGPSGDKTPQSLPLPKSEVNPRLRRRLIMTPEKSSANELGMVIAKKLKSLSYKLESVQSSK